MPNKSYLVLLLLGVAVVGAVFADECDECKSDECAALEFCPNGVAHDKCGCCNICAQGLGAECDLPKTKTYTHGSCGEYLECSKEGVCECEEEDEVCGSDMKTYSSLCELLAATAQDNQLNLIERAPCRTGPKIKSVPKDSIRPMGSILVLDCEATGVPVPIITWELNKPDGSTVKLPNDDSLIAVQTRGGPEKQMVTGWVQIMKITPQNVGLYTCIASNKSGEVKASAKVEIKQGDVTENEL